MRMPLRRLLTLDDDTCINSWLCGTAEFDFSDAEGSDGDLVILPPLPFR